jgi:hypothetical protein
MATLGLEWMMIIMVPIAMIGYILFAFYYISIKRDAPEAAVYALARKKHLPIMRIVDKSGREELYVAKKDKEGDLDFYNKKFKDLGIFIDPRVLSEVPEDRTHDGVPIYHYSIDLSVPISNKNVRAFTTILGFVRQQYPQLNFLDDLSLIEMIATPRDNLAHDCANYIDDYESEITLEELVETIVAIQDKASIMPIESGFFSYSEAFKNISTAMLPQDINQIIMWVYRKARKDVKFDTERLIQYGFAFAIVAVGGSMALYILKTMTN